jgi:hypothetical protein
LPTDPLIRPPEILVMLELLISLRMTLVKFFPVRFDTLLKVSFERLDSSTFEALFKVDFDTLLTLIELTLLNVQPERFEKSYFLVGVVVAGEVVVDGSVGPARL